MSHRIGSINHLFGGRQARGLGVGGGCFESPIGSGSLLSHLGGPQPQRHLGIGRIVFSTAEEIGQGFALEQAQLHEAPQCQATCRVP
jgi:hypothetical protein